jgi:O-antigen/teichoic acid export membrane protein
MILLGKEFLFAANTLKIFAFVLPITAVTHVLGRQWLMVRGNDSQYFKILLIASMIGIISIYILIKSFGILAIPLSLIFYELVTVLLILGFLRKVK